MLYFCDPAWIYKPDSPEEIRTWFSIYPSSFSKLPALGGLKDKVSEWILTVEFNSWYKVIVKHRSEQQQAPSPRPPFSAASTTNDLYLSAVCRFPPEKSWKKLESFRVRDYVDERSKSRDARLIEEGSLEFYNLLIFYFFFFHRGEC